ncbi:Related to oligopeptide ABC transporter, oligopeptide-binding protein [Acetoanaerobium sticklandii]|uniref:Related to oligopeptide ABC transporter, oligopeptide-binding protein n=1 Tax=Acetoanaerobium sticklandii (strain ATCC 12662 / DSM 519 / JCM 1433 / CCUG 9281 / NCIMB 10654 / HF) TaxID=499177 RepID=E3PR87_ACESD|nr:ABC transporter substrate-binding protein [Acetoanaerobium sticklandii]CBH20217.1 Related to oligopeptide ABC transporter, oligopeptide-binding protein [Acetoanaerobium sticklandii]
MKKKFLRVLNFMLVFSLLATLLVGCKSETTTQATSQEANEASSTEETLEPKFGGEITVAFQSAPDNFDPDHPSSDWVVTAVTNHTYEGLFEFSGQNQAVPHLAESYKVINDGKGYEIILRKGIKFHDGEEMKADDVKASMERWFKVNPAGAAIADTFTGIDIVDDYKLVVNFNEVYAPFINILASPVSRQKMLVKKKEIIDKFGESIITEHIGTGPFYFHEIVMGQKVVLKKYDDYVPLELEASGLAGKRVAYLDKVTIEFVPEESVRVSGLKSGQYDFIDELSTDRYDEVDSFPEISPTAANYGTIGVVAFNSGKSPFSDINLRKSVAYAINPHDMAAAQIGDSKFWSVDDGSWFAEGSIWYDAKAGEGIYNNHNVDKAKEYVEKSNYGGELITILGEKADLFMSNGALVLQNQLKEIGLNVEVQLYDKSTYSDYRQNGKWDITLSRWSDMNPDPQVFEPWTGTNGWITNWDDEDSRRIDEIFSRMEKEMDYDKRYKIVQEFYNEFWETLPYIKVFNDKRLYGIKDNLKGYAGFGQPYFWNVWISE